MGFQRQVRHLSSEVSAPGHTHSHVQPVAITIELASGRGVAQVGVVILGAPLLGHRLVPRSPEVEGEGLT